MIDPDLQNLFQQYNNNEKSWGGTTNRKLLQSIDNWCRAHYTKQYIHSRYFSQELKEFKSSMYTTAQRATPPFPNPDIILKNALRTLRKRIL